MNGLTDRGASIAMNGTAAVQRVRFPGGFRWTRRVNANRSFDDTDLGDVHARPRLWGHASFEGCTFQGLTLDGARLERTSFTGCRFDRVRFGRRLMGLIKGCTFERSTFSDVAFGGAQVIDSSFVACEFDRVDARDLTFRQTHIQGLTLSGNVSSCNLVDCTVSDLDAGRAYVEDLGIVGGSLRDVTWPHHDSNFAVAPSSLIEVMAEVEPKLRLESRARYEEMARLYSASSSPVVMIAKSGFREMTDVESDAVIGALRRFGVSKSPEPK
ncbi:MAG: pentapeptide repeat-containing protein [Acidobacteria bacterium]|nr:pentapeptide repeat-containing protein [Acidobacteriota bacterium]